MLEQQQIPPDLQTATHSYLPLPLPVLITYSLFSVRVCVYFCVCLLHDVSVCAYVSAYAQDCVKWPFFPHFLTCKLLATAGVQNLFAVFGGSVYTSMHEGAAFSPEISDER